MSVLRKWFGRLAGEAGRRELVIDARKRDGRADGVIPRRKRNDVRKAKRQAQRVARRLERGAR